MKIDYDHSNSDPESTSVRVRGCDMGMRRVLISGAWLVTVSALVVSMVPGVGARLGGAWPGLPVHGYPQRVGFIRGAPDLTSSAGRLALVVEDNNFGNATYEALNAAGRAWTVPSTTPPSLSPDGLLIATTVGRGDDTLLGIHNLRDGRTITQDEIRYAAGDPAADGPRPRLAYYPVMAWSADSSALLIQLRGRSAQPAVLDVATGQFHSVPGRGAPLGLLPDGQAVRLAVTGPEDAPALRVVAATPGGTAGPSTALRPDEPWGDPGRPLGWALAPDGELVVWDRAPDGGTRLRWFSVSDGSQTRTITADPDPICAVGWRGDQPVLSTKSRSYGHQAEALALGDDGDLESLVAVHHRMQSSCVTFANDALEAGPTRMLWGTWGALWTWYWRPLVLGLLLLGGLGWLWSRRGQKVSRR